MRGTSDVKDVITRSPETAGTTPLDTSDQLAELVIRRLGHAQQVLPGFGRGITPRMPLKQPDPQPLLQRIDVTDHRGMVHAQHLCRAADGADARNLIGGFDFVPIFHAKTIQLNMCVFQHAL